MANLNAPPNFVAIPVKDIGIVGVPVGMPAESLHDAIMEHLANNPPITARGAIENQPAFKATAKKAWNKTLLANAGTIFGNVGNTEAGFTVNNQGAPGPITVNRNENRDGSLKQISDENTLALFHTHPPVSEIEQKPSPADIADARRLGKPIMVASREGLFEVDATGTVHQVFKGVKWMDAPSRKKK